jgi:catechol-2,3-dioxygenase
MTSDVDRPVATSGLRHAVLWVTDPRVSAEFYGHALGLVVKGEPSENAVFMTSPGSTTDHDLGLFRAPVAIPPDPRQIGLYHLAWEVPTLADLAAAKARLADLGALVGENNHGVSRSLYCQDPDGIEFEVMWEVPAELVEPDEPSNVPLDLDADIARFGATRHSRGA